MMGYSRRIDYERCLFWCGSGAPGAEMFATYFPWVSGGVLSGVVGADIGLTAAREEKKQVPEGSTIGKIGTYGVASYSAYLGSMQVAGYRPLEKVGLDPYGNVYLRKYLTTFRGKPIIPVSKPLVLARTPVGIARVISPIPSKGDIRWVTPESFLKGTPEWGGPPSWEPYLGYSGNKPTSIYNIRPLKTTDVSVVKYGDKIFMGTGEGWQPYSPPVYPLSTRVLPKPKIYRSYENYFFIVTYNPPPVGVVKPKIDIKPFKPITKTAKDIIKSDKQIEKELGIGKDTGNGLRLLQKTKVETKTKVKTEQIVVPKQLQKQIVRYKTIQMVKPTTKQILQPFSRLETAYKKDLMQSQKKASVMLYGLKAESKTKQKKVSMLGISSLQSLKLDLASPTMQKNLSIQLKDAGQVQLVSTKYWYQQEMTIPKITIIRGHRYFPKSMSRTDEAPHKIIINPIIMPKMDPPLGNPKHSSSFRRRSRLTARVVFNGSPQLEHNSTFSSFFVPHLVQ